MFRSLIDRVELRPRDKGQGLEALLYGDLVEILGFCDKDEKRKLPERMTFRGVNCRWLRGEDLNL